MLQHTPKYGPPSSSNSSDPRSDMFKFNWERK